MKTPLLLVKNKNSLEFSIGDNDWCFVRFHHGQLDDLGADSSDVIIQRFLSILDIENFPSNTHTLGNHEYACFIMFFEKHASGYARVNGQNVIVQFRDSNGNMIGMVELAPEDRREWIKRLTEFRRKQV